MDKPPSFTILGISRLVCRLRCSPYVLQQSPHAWFDHFSSTLKHFGMTIYEEDHSIFFLHSSIDQCIFLVVYVYDIVMTRHDTEGIQHLKTHLFKNNQEKELGPLIYFLGTTKNKTFD